MPRRRARYFSTRLQFLAGLALVLLLGNELWLRYRSPLLQEQPQHHASTSSALLPSPTHPIGILISRAEERFQELLSGQTNDLSSGAAAYRLRRGFDPPPGFEKWVEYARMHNAVIVEEFFDQIYHDLTPYRGISAIKMRNFAQYFEPRISIRNGKANIANNENFDTDTTQFRLKAWLSLVQGIEHLLPDLDMALNIMDVSRVIVPWVEVNKHIQDGNEARKVHDPSQIVSTSQTLAHLNTTADRRSGVEFISSGQEPIWHIAREGCAPDAPARYVNASENLRGPPPFQQGSPIGSFHGFVQNWTQVRDICQQPVLQEAHGTFVEPVTVNVTKSLVPIFGEVKLSMSNDILIPPVAEISELLHPEPFFDADASGSDWWSKSAGVLWRGAASGGRNTEQTWTRFPRHRFVSMLNGTYVQSVMQDPRAGGEGKAFVLPSPTIYNLDVTEDMSTGTWLNRIVDVGFTDLMCFPPVAGPTCNYTDPFFKIAPPIRMAEQLRYKLLPDIDGDSISERYLGLLRSTSVPIKATIFSAWHDARLIPWVHFIPMDQSFVDVYGIMDYFLGIGYAYRTDYGKLIRQHNHDNEARKIAMNGKDWAEKVLRKEDMEIYMLRLLLEYARLCDDNRE